MNRGDTRSSGSWPSSSSSRWRRLARPRLGPIQFRASIVAGRGRAAAARCPVLPARPLRRIHTPVRKGLAYDPGRPLIEYWLGRAYLKSGYEETALRVWKPLLDAPDPPLFLKAKADFVVKNARPLLFHGGISQPPGEPRVFRILQCIMYCRPK